MIPDLENLIALQKRDLEIRAVESRLKRIPEEVANLEREIATEQANAKLAEERLSESLKSRRALEGELELVETKIDKYEDQLMQVKSNEEYRAMQKQIEHAKEEVSATEDKILARMEEADGLQEELEKRQNDLKHGQEQIRQMEAQLQSEASRLRTELQNRNGEREGVVKALPEKLLEQYHQVARLRGGISMAEAKDEHCQVCHVRLRPQVYGELRLGNKILCCDNCTRILYYLGPTSPGQEEEQA